MEVNVLRLQAYITFLTKYHNHIGEEFTQVLIEDISQLITSRKTISRNLCKSTEHGAETYYLLLDLFCAAVKNELKPASEEHQWVCCF